MTDENGDNAVPEPDSPAPVPNDDERPEFDAAALALLWPVVSCAINRSLLARGCNRADCEDFMQETAVRVIQHQVRFRDADDLRHYAVTVAIRLHLNAIRKAPAVNIETTQARQLVWSDLESLVEHRLAIASILPELNKITDEDMAILLNKSGSPADKRDANRQYVQRHRMRAGLRGLSGGLLAIAVLLAAATSPTHPTTSHTRVLLRSTNNYAGFRGRLKAM